MPPGPYVSPRYCRFFLNGAARPTASSTGKRRCTAHPCLPAAAYAMPRKTAIHTPRASVCTFSVSACDAAHETASCSAAAEMAAVEGGISARTCPVVDFMPQHFPRDSLLVKVLHHRLRLRVEGQVLQVRRAQAGARAPALVRPRRGVGARSTYLLSARARERVRARGGPG